MSVADSLLIPGRILPLCGTSARGSRPLAQPRRRLSPLNGHPAQSPSAIAAARPASMDCTSGKAHQRRHRCRRVGL